PHQAQLAQTDGGDQDLAQRRLRPAAAGQGGVQRSMSGRLAGSKGRSILATPDAAHVEQVVQSYHGGHGNNPKYCMQIQYSRYPMRVKGRPASLVRLSASPASP